MAKGKKSSGKHYTSKGQRPNTNRNLLKAVRKDVSPLTRAIYKLEALGKVKKGPSQSLVPNMDTHKELS
jgi:hypothetical protein